MTVCIAVAGAGLIGRRHVEEIVSSPDAHLAAIVDPSPEAAELAAGLGVARFSCLADLFAADRPDGVILATPNRMHRDGALECIAAGVPVIVEKPLADTVDAAREVVDAAEAAGVPLLTGHHRTYSSVMARARQIIASGTLGRLVAVQGSAVFYKPDDYFDVGDGWRRKPGGGPIMINLVHEINNLMMLLGPVTHVQAMTSSATRGFPVEDTAALTLRFANGALGSFLLSDTAASARSWEQTSRENLSYDHHDEDCYLVIGTDGSLAVPTMTLTRFEGERSWWAPLTRTPGEPLAVLDPLAAQISHFAGVIRGVESPLCDGRSGLETLVVCAAVADAAASGTTVATGLVAR